MHIGEIIKTLRKEQGVTQDDLAAALNISPHFEFVVSLIRKHTKKSIS